MVENVTIFVARDEAEFNKYKLGADTFTSCSVAREDSENEECGEITPDGEISCPVEKELGECLYDRTKSVIVYQFKDVKDKEAIRDELSRKNTSKVRELFTNLKYCLEVILNLKGDEKDKTFPLKSGLIFIHWGDGDPLTFEQDFRKIIESDKDTYSFVFEKVRAYAISTRRREFDVSGPQIKLPRDAKEIERLEMRFGFDLFKEQMSEYVERAQSEVDIDGTKMCDLCMSEFALKTLRAYLDDKRKVWTSMYYSKAEKDRRRALIDKVCGVNDGDVTQGVLPKKPNDDNIIYIPLDMGIAELFSIILQEDALHD